MGWIEIRLDSSIASMCFDDLKHNLVGTIRLLIDSKPNKSGIGNFGKNIVDTINVNIFDTITRKMKRQQVGWNEQSQSMLEDESFSCFKLFVLSSHRFMCSSAPWRLTPSNMPPFPFGASATRCFCSSMIFPSFDRAGNSLCWKKYKSDSGRPKKLWERKKAKVALWVTIEV